MKATRVDEKITSWIDKYCQAIVFALLLFISFLIRFLLRDGISGDAQSKLICWYEEIRSNGGLRALSAQVGDYNMFYQFILALVTYLPIQPIYAIKLSSIVFDYLLAFAADLFVRELTENREYGRWAFLIVVLSPLVFINSAWWAQCDAMYASLCVLSLVYLVKAKYTTSFLLYGFSFAFKLQGIFLFPLFLFLYVYQKRYSVLNFLLIPFMTAISALPCVIAGRGKKSVIRVITFYFWESGIWRKMYLNYPGFWALMGTNSEEFFNIFHTAAICLTVALLATFMYYWKKKSVQLTKVNILYMAFLLSYTCVYFLPAMHERYNFIAEILGIVILFIIPKTIVLLIPLNLISIATYGSYLLTGGSSTHLQILSVINGAVLLGYLLLLQKKMTGNHEAWLLK